MMLLMSMLLTASTVTSVPAPPPEFTAIPTPSMSLRAAASEAARRDARALTPKIARNVAPPLHYRKPRGPRHHSLATRVTAVAAGTIAGALGGLVCGAAIGAPTGEGGALVGMTYGIPIGAAIGGLWTAYYVR
jgi:hypothetical protein